MASFGTAVVGIAFKDVFKELELVTAPAFDTLPVSLSKAKEHCRIPTDVTNEDAILQAMIVSAESLVESLSEYVVRQKTYNLNMARWPSYLDYMILRLEVMPIQSITHIKYYNESDVQQTLSSSLYELWAYSTPPKVLVRAENVPATSLERSKAIEIRFVAGTPSTAPTDPTAELAILELVAFWYQNREAYGRLPENSAQARVFNSLIEKLTWRGY